MKKIYGSIVLGVCFCISGFGQTPGWKTRMIGIWKVDSVQTDHKKMSSFQKKELEKHSQYYSFSKNNSMVFYTDSVLFVRDSFAAGEVNGKMIVFNKITYMEVRDIRDGQMTLALTEPGLNRSRRQVNLWFLTRADAKNIFPDIAGSWSGRNAGGYGRFTDKNSNIMTLNKNGKIKLRIDNKPESGTWTIDRDNFAITMNLESGNYTSYLVSKDNNKLEITNPYFSDELLDFEMELPGNYNPQGEKELPIGNQVQISDYKTYSTDSAAPEKIYNKWTAVKIIAGKDSSDPGKSISVLFLKDHHFVITVNNKKTEGRWTINTSGGTIIFKSKDQEILCLYRLQAERPSFMDRSYPDIRSGLLLTLALPGEKEVKTYLMR
jgi:hypothetical protein